MLYEFTPSVIPILASALLILGLSVYGIAHLRTRGAKELVVISLIVVLWGIANAGEHAGADLGTKLFWANLQYLCYAFLPVTLLALVFRFNGKESYATPRNLALLSILPTITSILVWFDPALGLVRHSFSLLVDGDVAYIGKDYGPWFWFHYVYSYSLHLISLGLLIAAVGKRGSIFRRQSIYLLVSVCIFYAANLSYVLGLSPLKHYDVTPMVFGLSALILYWGIFHDKLIKIPPIARAKVFEGMAAGILVLDEKWNLIDSNESAQAMLDIGSEEFVGKSLRERIVPASLVAGSPPPIEGTRDAKTSFHWEIAMPGPSGERFLELNASRIRDPRYKSSWVILAADITDLKRAREQIIRQREELATASERDRLSMELHDTLGQVLSFAVIQTDTALRELGKGKGELASTYMRRLSDILRGAHEDLRGFVRGIRAAEYESISLPAILAKEAERFERECGIPARLNLSREEPEPSPFAKAHLASIVKESLNNIAKHAKATEVSIEFAAKGDDALLVIEDNGVGMAGAGAGSGLGIMSERASSIRGSIDFSPREGGGTRMILEFPLPREREDEDTDS